MSIKTATYVPITAIGHAPWSPNAGAHKFISMTTNAQCDGDGKNAGPLVVRGPRPVHDGCRTLGRSVRRGSRPHLELWPSVSLSTDRHTCRPTETTCRAPWPRSMPGGDIPHPHSSIESSLLIAGGLYSVTALRESPPLSRGKRQPQSLVW